MIENAKAHLLVIGDPKKGITPRLQAASIHTMQVEVLSARTFKDAKQILIENPIDLIVAEFELSDGDAIEFLESLNRITARLTPVIILADQKDEKMAINVFRKGAKDFLVKDINGRYLQRLPLIIERVLKEELRYRENLRKKVNTDLILSAISDGVIGLSLNNKVIFANPAAALYLKCQFEKMIGSDIWELIDDIEGFDVALKKAMESAKSNNQVIDLGNHSLKLGDEKDPILVQVNLLPMLNDLMHLEGHIISFQEAMGQLNDDKSSFFSSIQDELTGLINRKAFVHRVKHTVTYCNRYQTKCAVLFVDLDGFKPINDTLGHVYGDQLLVKVTKRIKSVVREADVLSRVGGDEYAILLTHVNHVNDAGKVADKINQVLAEPFELNKYQYFITASIGIALYPNDSIDPEQLIQFADFAMSLAKKRGKNCYQYYESELNKLADREIRLTHELHAAIEKEQLQLHFHPQINLKTNELMGVEALVRWKHPELGLVSPAVFIPIAEDHGIIKDIGKWVLQKACESFLKWDKEGFEQFFISVNISVKELQERGFINQVSKIVQDYAIAPDRIQFEITESIFASNAQSVIGKLRALKEMGFSIAMDDFGTGYSCLSYLRDLPIDVIKIDQSFVQGLEGSQTERHQEIIGAIIELSKRLGITVLAEGVETKMQAERLKKLGCDHVQGFLFSKPIPFEKMSLYLKQYHPSDIQKIIGN